MHILRNQAPSRLSQSSVTAIQQFTYEVTSEVTNQAESLLPSRQRSLKPILCLPILHEHFTKFESGMVVLLIIISPVQMSAPLHAPSSKPSVSDSSSLEVTVDRHALSNDAADPESAPGIVASLSPLDIRSLEQSSQHLRLVHHYQRPSQKHPHTVS